MDAHNEYIIGGGAEGRKRLSVLADVMHPYTWSLLEAQCVSPGSSFLDVGCGGGHVAEMVALMTGEHGRVTAIDFDEKIIALNAADTHAGNITFHTLPADAMAFENEFDFVYARFLLSHVKGPADVLEQMKRAAKPGGKIIVEDVQFSGHFCYPPCPAFEQYVQYYTLAATQNGADANIGPALFSLFQEADIKNVGFDVIQPCGNNGSAKQMASITLDRITDTLINHNIASLQTIKDLKQELDDYAKNEHTIMSLPRIFRVWGVSNVRSGDQ